MHESLPVPSSTEFDPTDRHSSPLYVPPLPPKPPSGEPATSRVTWLLTMLVVMLVVTYLLPQLVERLEYSITKGRQRAEYEVAREGLDHLPLAELSKAYQLISYRVSPSVVHINLGLTTSAVALRDKAGDMPPHWQAQGQGSGVIVDPEGFILTNSHVVQGSERIQVKLSDGRRVDAQLVGSDRLTDLALIKVDLKDLTAIEWGDSEEIEVGALVWAVGSPFGLEQSITSGILSAKNRAEFGHPHQDFLQTDAAVNPGNSGGPLVDVRGRLIGINTAIIGDVYQGISFAVPSNVARQVYLGLKRQGRVVRGWLGVRPTEVPEEVVNQLKLEPPYGAFVESVQPTGYRPSPAMRAGLHTGDIINRWNGQPIPDSRALYSAVANATIGQPVDVTLLRDGHEMCVQITVDEREDD